MSQLYSNFPLRKKVQRNTTEAIIFVCLKNINLIDFHSENLSYEIHVKVVLYLNDISLSIGYLVRLPQCDRVHVSRIGEES